MPQFTISAYQEMYIEQIVEADNVREAADKFRNLVKNGEVVWEPSDADLDIAEVCDEDGDQYEMAEWE